MRKANVTATILVLALALFIPMAVQAKPPGGHLTITEVWVDCEAETITIMGVDFDFGPGPLGVILGDFPAPLSIVGIPTANEIVVVAPGGLCEQAGDLLLTVSTGTGQSQRDEYDLTIGAVGPMPEHEWDGTSLAMENPDGTFGPYVNLKGVKGDQGETGPQGPKGDKGDTGAMGPQGPQGEQGRQGRQGPIGLTGPKG